MLKWSLRCSVDGSSSTNHSSRLWRHRSRRFFEKLEDRRLLSISPGLDYEHVASDWFDTKVDLVVAVARSFDFIGPLTLAEFEARSALFSNESVVQTTQEQSTEQWIVRLTSEATSLLSQVEDAEDLLRTSTAEFRIVRGLGLPGQLLVEAPEASAQEVQVALQSNPLVDCFGGNRSVSGQVLPDDTDFDQLWALTNQGQTGGTTDADIDAPEAWDITTGSANVVVAVIDSGVDYSHPDLYKNIWINQGEIPAAIQAILTDTDSDGRITFYDLNEAANATYVTDSLTQPATSTLQIFWPIPIGLTRSTPTEMGTRTIWSAGTLAGAAQTTTPWMVLGTAPTWRARLPQPATMRRAPPASPGKRRSYR